ncbi:HDOD domain-containing protein [Marinobacter psychrophilus]|jgi:HD-like signal output (HDOD) protein|uniref:HDOD domain-containing protein n=1 Tax=Marinobacter psychrophilus TaxID=330734 RepID=UPI001B66FC87|nr:HDOD domain-containing protein [Marinobacter psychrophilus]MBQ0762569.1 HDOD domain-containing protein [Marinobacter psychrophilus]MBQ0845707.1 HDOD domain-containing protein [Marinobacter psychrophilus]
MEVPATVRQALGKCATSIALRDVDKADPDQLLRMVLLSDGCHKLQVIYRSCDLLDLETLNTHLRHSYTLLPAAEQQRLCGRLGLSELSELPALPALTGWRTVIDSAVDAGSAVALMLQNPHLAMVMPAHEFMDLCGEAGRLNCAVAVAPLAEAIADHGNDREQVHFAIKRFTSLRIRQRLEDTLELPPLPETARRIIRLRTDPNSVMADLVDIVESDPSLAAQIISWASSSFYAAPGRVNSVHDAISRVLGFDMVMNLAMGLSLGRVLRPPTRGIRGYEDYWQQSAWLANGAGLLASLITGAGRPVFGLAYLAGLLHNFGTLVLAHVFPPHFSLLCHAQEVNPGLDSSIVERHLLGITGGQIAAQLMENWSMPEEVTSAVRQHKNPAAAGEHQVYSQVLWLARQLLTERGIGLGVGEPITPSIYRQLGLDPKRVHERFDQLITNRDSVLEMASMLTPR